MSLAGGENLCQLFLPGLRAETGETRMPIYEFRCSRCGRKSEYITLRVSETFSPVCKHCSSEEVARVPSRVRVRLSEETRLERLADPSRFAGLDENDPKSMAKWMKEMGREMGDDLGGEDVDALVDEALAGGDPGGESGEGSGNDDL
jgi:putative FmdB family regulatory protein